jgi:hypothetical protein
VSVKSGRFRQSLVQELEDLDKQKLQLDTNTDREQLKASLLEILHRRQVLLLAHEGILQQISLKEQQLLDPPERPLCEEGRLSKMQVNIDYEPKANFDALQTAPSYSQHMAQFARDQAEAHRVQHLSPREKILHQAGLLKPDGSLTRQLTQHDEDVIRHSLSLPDANSGLGIAGSQPISGAPEPS